MSRIVCGCFYAVVNDYIPEEICSSYWNDLYVIVVFVFCAHNKLVFISLKVQICKSRFTKDEYRKK